MRTIIVFWCFIVGIAGIWSDICCNSLTSRSRCVSASSPPPPYADVPGSLALAAPGFVSRTCTELGARPPWTFCFWATYCFLEQQTSPMIVHDLELLQVSEKTLCILLLFFQHLFQELGATAAMKSTIDVRIASSNPETSRSLCSCSLRYLSTILLINIMVCKTLRFCLLVLKRSCSSISMRLESIHHNFYVFRR